MVGLFLAILFYDMGFVSTDVPDQQANRSLSTNALSEVILIEIKNISLEGYWLGRSDHIRLNDEISSMKLQVVDTNYSTLADQSHNPSLIIVAGLKRVPDSVTGFELYYPKDKEYNMLFKHVAPENSGIYRLLFYEGDERFKVGTKIKFTVNVFPCGEKYCVNLGN